MTKQFLPAESGFLLEAIGMCFVSCCYYTVSGQIYQAFLEFHKGRLVKVDEVAAWKNTKQHAPI